MDVRSTISGVLARAFVIPALLRAVVGQRIWAVTALTWKAAFRFRLFWVLAALLLGSVVLLPLLLKDDGTARGFIQIMLTYTLSVIAALLGFATLWLACGTLARDIEDCQMQMVAVKPIARWQIWVGKWLGILLLNATLLALAGGCVYGLLMWRAQQLEPDQAQILRDEIFVARASIQPPAPDINTIARREFERRRGGVPEGEHPELYRMIFEEAKAGWQMVPPQSTRTWNIDLGLKQFLARDKPLYLRVKFHVADTNRSGTYIGRWLVGPPGDPKAESLPQSLAADTFHEIRIPANVFGGDGKLAVMFYNFNDTALIFPLEDGVELLYREGGFGLNFARGLGIILCWLALLASVGLAASSLMSFPVAAFVSFSLLAIAFSGGTLSNAVAEGTVTGVDHESGAGGGGLLDLLLLPLFKGILSVLNLVQSFSPVDALSTGRSITWEQLGTAFAQIVLLLGGMLAVAGIACFTRRELATAQGTN